MIVGTSSSAHHDSSSGNARSGATEDQEKQSKRFKTKSQSSQSKSQATKSQSSTCREYATGKSRSKSPRPSTSTFRKDSPSSRKRKNPIRQSPCKHRGGCNEHKMSKLSTGHVNVCGARAN